MHLFSMHRRLCCQLVSAALGLTGLCSLATAAEVLVPTITSTNTGIRVMAANLNGDSQSYQDFALRIFQGLKPDVVAIQEFNYLGNTANDLRTMVNAAFGTNYSFYRESGAGYSIPNGIISRWPIVGSGSWEDTDPGVNDRGFAWARIDVPGTNDLYVVSVHLKASSGSDNATRRTAQASAIKALVQQHFPSNAWIVVAGDCNIQDPSEAALATFKTFLSDTPIPTDAPSSGDADTNNGRSERYDYVFPSPTLSTNRVATVVGSRTFPNGLVFDSRIYAPLTDVAPVQAADSGNAQHMAVVRDFRISYTVTNLVLVTPPVLSMISTNVIRWAGTSNLSYTVQSGATLGNWQAAGKVTSSTTNFAFTNQPSGAPRGFFRVVYP